MTVQINAYDPDNNGIGIYLSQYLYQKFASFTDVAGKLSTDADATEYAFIGADGGGIVFHAADGWSRDPVTGEITGTLDIVTFGQNTTTAVDGTFQQSVELKFSDLDISDSPTLQSIFAGAADGKFQNLTDAVVDEAHIIQGSASKDSLFGGNEADIIRGGAGDDRIYGFEDKYNGVGDRLVGGDGNDRIIGSMGHDVIYGGSGNDFIRGMIGDDIIKGEGGDDRITGDTGNDVLWGGDGDDYLFGVRGRDQLNGGEGNDNLWGGSNIDTFVFEKNAGDDTIWDFKPGKVGKDVIEFHDVGLNSFQDVMEHAVKIAGGVMITYDEGSLFLDRVRLSQLDSHDFLFT